MAVDQNQSMKFCKFCGKVIRTGRVGTMTSWIFGGNACNCGSSNSTNSTDSSHPSSDDLTAGAQIFDGVNRPLTPTPTPAYADSHSTEATSAPRPDLGDRFAILELLGEGGMGTVYKVEELKTGKVFAAKVLKPELARDPAALKRFEQEVGAAGELTHQNLVFVYGASHARDGTPYMVMNYVDGTNLTETLRANEVLAPERAVPIFTQIAEALAHAHSKGIIHRDLKPSNILIYQHETQADAVRLVDFGIAKKTSQGNATELTQTGELFGSPLYMSPEQCLGEPLDARSDIYSLGCVMYQTLCGQPPFNETKALKAMIAHMQTKPRPFRQVNKNVDIPAKLEAIVMRCLHKDADKRYQSAGELLVDLELVRSGRHSIKEGRNRLAIYWLVTVCSIIVTSCFAFGFLRFIRPPQSHEVSRAKSNGLTDAGGLPESQAVPIPRFVKSPLPKNTSTASLLLDMLKKQPASIDLSGFYIYASTPTDADTVILKNVPFVTAIDLNNTEITEIGLRNVATMPNLQTLSLTSQTVQDWSSLQKLTHLATLILGRSKLNTAAYITIGKIPNLGLLNLNETNVHDSDLMYFSQLKNLKKIFLVRCPNITQQGLSRFHEQHPECEIFVNPYAHERWSPN